MAGTFKLARKTVLLAKKETTYGTDAVPVAGANAIQITEPTITPLAGGKVAHNYLRPELGASPSIPVNKNVVVSFAVALAGAGAAGTVPAYGPLLTACATAETINVGVDVQYYPTSASAIDALSMYFFKDGTLHKLLGARGNVLMIFPPNDIPHFKFDFIGLFVDPLAVANPTPTLTAFKDPLPVNNTNTATFSLHGYTGVLETLELNLGNVIDPRDRPGSNEVLRTDRQGSGSVSIESPALGVKNYFAAVTAETRAALQIIHGATAGNIVQIDAPKVQVEEPAYEDSQGLEILKLGLNLTPDAGDDEIKITIK